MDHLIINHEFIYKRNKSFVLNVVGYFLAGFAILGFSESPIIGISLAVSSALFLLYQTGIQVEFDKKQYRYFTTFKFLKWGKWLPFPEVKYISIFKVNLVSTHTSRAGKTLTLENQVIQVNLITSDKKRILLFETLNPNEAFEFAKKVAEILLLKIWDASEKDNNHWL